MKYFLIYSIILFTLVFSSCKAPVPAHEDPVQEPKYILSNFGSFWNYWYSVVRLSEDFVPYDENDSVVSKDLFLKKVLSGDYLPLKLKSNDTSSYYRLYKIHEDVDSDITYNLKRFGELYYQFFQMEEKPLPRFNFVDINGNLYNRENCKGKIVVLNFWFIGCTACQREMPALNKIVDSYKDRKDIVFLSIAPDNKDKLKKFLEKTPFTYAAVADKGHYVIDTLNINMFPTQMIINRKGEVARVPEDDKELAIELKKELLK
ncbi:MAG: TlpA disulfide reductase family protein [Ginsengibacter sp.]